MSKRTAGLCFLLLFLTRAALVLSLADVFFYGDELSKSGGSKALLDGTGIASWRLTYVYHEGGGYLVMVLKALLFALVGPSVLAVKLTAILTTGLLLGVGLWLAAEHFGRRAAAIFGLLVVFCPDAYLRCSMLSIGTHFESVIPIALVFHFALRVLRDEPPRRADWIRLGLFSGLGAYFSLQTAPALAVVALAVLVRRRGRELAAGAGAALLGFAVGALPLWVMMGHAGLAALLVQGHTGFTTGPTGLDALRELARPLLELDPAAWVQTAAFGAVIAAGLLVPAGDAGRVLRARSLPILAYLALFVAILLGSGFLFPNRGHWIFWLRCSPLWFFAALLFAACAAHLIERGRGAWREIATGAVAVVLVFGFAAFAGLVAGGRPWAPDRNWKALVRTKGYDLQNYFDKLAHHVEGTIPERFAILLRIRDDPQLVCPSAAHALFEKSGVGLAEAVEITRASCGQSWPAGLRGLGLAVAPDYGHDVGAAFRRIAERPEEERAPLAEALGRVALGILNLPEKIEEQARLPVPAALREPFLRGAGWRVHRLYPLRHDLALELIGRQPIETFLPMLAGYLDAREASSLE
jgi:hypothetical protein